MATIYIPTFLSPKFVSIDGNFDNIFTAQINGQTCTSYRLLIMRVSDNAIVYDSNQISLNPVLHDKDILTYTLPKNTITNGQSFKWTIQVFNGNETVTSSETLFYAYTTHKVSMTIPNTIKSMQYDFVMNYTQAENIASQKYKYILFDKYGNTLKDTDWIYSGSLKYTCDILNNNTSYFIQGFVINQNGVEVSTEKLNFNVEYFFPSLPVVPSVTQSNELGTVTLNWDNMNNNIGTVSGGYSFIKNYQAIGNTALQLDSNSIASFDVDIPEDFIIEIKYTATTGFTGVMVDLDEIYKIGYENGKFYFDNNGIVAYSHVIELPTDPFLICVRSQDVVIIQDNLILTTILVNS